MICTYIGDDATLSCEFCRRSKSRGKLGVSPSFISLTLEVFVDLCHE